MSITEEKNLKKKPIKKVASEIDYDTCKTLPVEEQRDIDKAAQKLETIAANLIREILSTNKIPDDPLKKQQLAEFFGYSHTRTRGKREAFKRIVVATNREILRHLTKTQEGRKWFTKFATEKGMEEKEAAELVDNVNSEEIGIEFNSEDYFQAHLAVEGLMAAKYFLKREWSIMESEADMITSDQPICLLPPIKRINPNPTGNVGVGNSNIIIPLTPRKAILMPYDDIALFGEKFSTEMVDGINKRMCEMAHKNIFAQTNSETIKDLFNKTEYNPLSNATILSQFGARVTKM